MRNTGSRLQNGLSPLFVVALVASLLGFLLIMVMRRATGTGPEKQPQLPKPQRNNNPLAIVQTSPDKWKGLIGHDAGDFLTFDTAANGYRAGFINLWNHYLKRGVNTIEKIGQTYPGPNDLAWPKGVSSISGYPQTKVLTWANVATLARAIERFENGYQWVPEDEFRKGLELATAYTKAK